MVDPDCQEPLDAFHGFMHAKRVLIETPCTPALRVLTALLKPQLSLRGPICGREGRKIRVCGQQKSVKSSQVS